MSTEQDNKSSVGAVWDRYWQGTWQAAAHKDGSPQEVALEEFWREFFQAGAPTASKLKPPSQPRLLDVACGNGAVIRHARQPLGDAAQCFALDYSHSALLNLQSRYPEVCCLAGDANHPALAAASFDWVVSQFGVEYAGSTAVTAIADLVAPGGQLALVLHLKDGEIYKECAHNQQVLLALQELNILELARAAFRAGYALNAGSGTVPDFKQAEQAFTPAVRGLEQLLRRVGNEVADGLPKQLYRDIAAMYPQMSGYEETEVMAWLDGMVAELHAYTGRMASMVNVALDAASLEHHCQQLSKLGFSNVRRDKLRIGSSAELAWTVLAQRATLPAA